ncbi:hypothetical protein Agub_g10231, partial [Astrephomene gubernaculifera]
PYRRHQAVTLLKPFASPPKQHKSMELSTAPKQRLVQNPKSLRESSTPAVIYPVSTPSSSPHVNATNSKIATLCPQLRLNKRDTFPSTATSALLHSSPQLTPTPLPKSPVVPILQILPTNPITPNLLLSPSNRLLRRRMVIL